MAWLGFLATLDKKCLTETKCSRFLRVWDEQRWRDFGKNVEGAVHSGKWETFISTYSRKKGQNCVSFLFWKDFSSHNNFPLCFSAWWASRASLKRPGFFKHVCHLALGRPTDDKLLLTTKLLCSKERRVRSFMNFCL